MGETSVAALGLAAAAVVVVSTGIFLTRAGRPFSTLLLNVHKLVDLAALIALGVLVSRVARSDPLSGAQWMGVGVAGALCVAALVTGGVVSANDSAPPWVVWTHRVGSWAAVLAASWCAWLVLP